MHGDEDERQRQGVAGIARGPRALAEHAREVQGDGAAARAPQRRGPTRAAGTAHTSPGTATWGGRTVHGWRRDVFAAVHAVAQVLARERAQRVSWRVLRAELGQGDDATATAQNASGHLGVLVDRPPLIPAAEAVEQPARPHPGEDARRELDLAAPARRRRRSSDWSLRWPVACPGPWSHAATTPRSRRESAGRPPSRRRPAGGGRSPRER